MHQKHILVQLTNCAFVDEHMHHLEGVCMKGSDGGC